MVMLQALALLFASQASADRSSGDGPPLTEPSAAAASIVSYFIHPESTEEHYGGGLLVLSGDPAQGRRMILITARHILDGSDYSVVTVRDSGSARGLGRLSVRIPTEVGVTVFYPEAGVDLAALVLDGAMEDDEENIAAFAAHSIPEEHLGFAAYVRAVDPVLWFSAGRQQVLRGAVMPVPHEERTVFVDMRPMPGYSGNPVFAAGVDRDGEPVLYGIIIAGYVEINPDEYRVMDLSVITGSPLAGFPSFLALEPAAEVRRLLESLR
jgi:hypothetical protein